MNETPSTGELARLPLSEILDRFGARTPAPGGGAAAALVAALGAAPVQTASGWADCPAAGSLGQPATVASQHATATARET